MITEPVSAQELAALVRGVADGNCEFEKLIQALLPLIRGEESLSPEVSLELASVLLDIERSSARTDQLFALINDQGAASVALNESGQILTLNSSAAELFHITTGDGLSALGISRTEFDDFTARLTVGDGSSLLQARQRDSRRTAVLMTGTYFPWYRAFVLTALQEHWPSSIDMAFSELYDLTKSELEILSLLARGMNGEAIAAQRIRSIGTVRQQIKSILHKLGTTSQLKAATMAATAAAALTHMTGETGTPAGYLPLENRQAPGIKISSCIRKQRRIGWRQYGNPEGKAVLFLHGPSFGAGEYPADRINAQRHNLNVLAVERPGYGRSNEPLPDETALECCVADALAVMDLAGFDRVTILAHEVALIPALEIACRHPERVGAVLAVSSAPPFLELEQIQGIPEHQGIFIQAVRHAPWLAHLLIRLLMVQVRKLGPHEWTSVIFRDLQPDTDVMRRPDLLPGIIGSYSFYLNQMGAGFEQDLQIMITDWGSLVSELPVPLVLMHGSENPTTTVEHLNLFRSLRKDIHMDIIDTAGLTLAVSHPHLIHARLAELAV